MDDPSLSYAVVVAFDPGGVTGWSMFAVHPNSLDIPRLRVLSNVEIWMHGQIDCREDEGAGIDQMFAVAARWAKPVRILESFTIRMLNPTPEYCSPIRITAGFDAKARDAGWPDTYRQTPSDAKTTCTNERLKKWGFYISKGGLGHARDADRHALLMLRRAKDPKLGAARRHEWWPHLYGPDGKYLN
jgi:hypothetical protein